MVTIIYKTHDEDIETVRWMRDVWKEEWVVKPTSIDVRIDKLMATEMDYLNKVMEWVYKDGKGTMVLNGKEYTVEELVRKDEC